MFESRKRIVMDRGPSWPDYDKAEPFMVRYYPLFRKRPKWFPFNIFVHQILKSDSCLLYTSPSPRDLAVSRMPSSA